MRANPLRGQVGGGWALEIETFLFPVKWLRAVRRAPFGPQKSRDFQGQPPPTCLSTVMDLPASKALRTGPYQSKVHRQFYAHELPGPTARLWRSEQAQCSKFFLPHCPPPPTQLVNLNYKTY